MSKIAAAGKPGIDAAIPHCGMPGEGFKCPW